MKLLNTNVALRSRYSLLQCWMQGSLHLTCIASYSQVALTMQYMYTYLTNFPENAYILMRLPNTNYSICPPPRACPVVQSRCLRWSQWSADLPTPLFSGLEFSFVVPVYGLKPGHLGLFTLSWPGIAGLGPVFLHPSVLSLCENVNLLLTCIQRLVSNNQGILTVQT